MPSPLAAPLAWDLVADAYSTEIAPRTEFFATQALEWARVHGPQRVVDVAAGSGALSVVAAGMGAKVSAIDFSPAMIERLQQRATERNLEIDARLGDGMALPFPDGTFDAGFSMFGLMFFPNRARGLSELRRVLRPNGAAVISSWVPATRVPLMGEFFAALRAELPELPLGDASAPLSSVESCTAEFTAAGFRGVEVRELTHVTTTSSLEEFVRAEQRTNASMVLLQQRLGPERSKVLGENVYERLRERFGDGPQEVRFTALLTKAAA